MDFAVIVPTHDRPRLVVEAVESILAQTVPAAEIVVVVDGPDPRVQTALSDRAVRVLEQPSRGVAAARNLGISATTSPWVCFLDDDDLWHPERLAVTARYLEANPNVAAVQAGSWVFTADPSREPESDFVAADLRECIEKAGSITSVRSDWSFLDIEGHSFDLLLARNRGNISAATVRRDVLHRAGGFPAGSVCAEDWTMFLNVARLTEWYYIAERLSFLRVHAGNNTTSNAARNGFATLEAVERAWDESILPDPPHRPLVAYASEYRYLTRASIWDALRAKQFDLARSSLRVGWRLLPRWRDRASTLVSPALIHRARRTIS